MFRAVPGIEFFFEPNENFYSNHWLSCIFIDPTSAGEITAETLLGALEAENIETRPLGKPMHLQPVLADVPYYGDSVAEDRFKNGLCLPSGSNLKEEDRQRITAAIEKNI